MSIELELENIKNQSMDRIIRCLKENFITREQAREMIVKEELLPIDLRKKENSIKENSIEEILDELDQLSIDYNLKFTRRERNRDTDYIRKRFAALKKEQNDMGNNFEKRIQLLEKE